MSGARRIFIIAGENSGDLHASQLIRAVRRLDSETKFYGLGGPQMQEAGAEIIQNIVRDLAIVGLTPVIRNIRKIFRLLQMTRERLEKDRPDALVCVDYPGFNLRVAGYAKKLGIPVIYYICPQVWGWHYSRIYKIAKVVDMALVIFPFEKRMYEKVGVNVHYVGHPLLDKLRITRGREAICSHFGLDPKRLLIGLMPGSRKPEVIRHLPIMLDAAERILEALPTAQFVLPRSTTIDRTLLEKYLERSRASVRIIEEQRLNMRKALDFEIVKSGTSTLESGAMLVPMVIIYKVSFLSWFVGKMVIRLPFLGLVNIVAGERIVPELLQDECTGERIADETLSILTDDERRANMVYQLNQVREGLGGAGAGKRAGALVCQFLDGKAGQESGKKPQAT
ncbi:MAG: lipid-A-disaccharide synthase [Candidatus Sumerlaeota bacterium]|nr:lipid-A-disaccharide synthase [Candidatus Sumerlaeota bacterium]